MTPKFDNLKNDYSSLLSTSTLKTRTAFAAEVAAHKVLAGRVRYQTVSAALGVPWLVIGLIHAMESGVCFETHLHNGDPLKERTVNVPRGRPRRGKTPFTWEESAADAIRYAGLDKVDEWSRERLCYELESYNGWGYWRQHPNVKSPYLWSGTSNYTRGKYVSDGQWSGSSVSKQPGAIAILMHIESLDPSLGKEFPTSCVSIDDTDAAEELTPESFRSAKPTAPILKTATVTATAGVGFASTQIEKFSDIAQSIMNASVWKAIGPKIPNFVHFLIGLPFLFVGVLLTVAILIFAPILLPYIKNAK